MNVVFIILGILCVLTGLMLFWGDTDSQKKGGGLCLFVGLVLLILGTPDLSRRLRTVKVGGLEASFAEQPASLTPQQEAGAQQAQEKWFAPQPASKSAASQLTSQQAPVQPASAKSDPLGGTNAAASLFADIFRRYRERSDTLHRALKEEGYTPAPDPSTDLTPGTVVRIAQDGGVTVYLKQKDAFPQLDVKSSAFDFRQFTSLGGTKEGFSRIGTFECQHGFRENINLAYAVTPIAPVADAALKQGSSLHVVRSVLGCYGNETSFLIQSLHSSPAPQVPPKRYILGFQLAMTLRPGAPGSRPSFGR